MNGAESLIATAVGAGVEICFANPGTTEMPLVAALDSVGGMRAVLGLHENVCTGAADGYGRMAGKPAMTLLHLGPGLTNGMANLHNARRGRVPVFNVVGEHATWHLDADPPLHMDIDALARTVSCWTRTTADATAVGNDTASAVAAAMAGGVATLIVPHDHQLGSAPGPALPSPPEARGVDAKRISRAVEALRVGQTALLLGGRALAHRGLDLAAGIAAKTGADLLCETFPARMERGRGIAAPERLPYFPEQVCELLQRYSAVLLVGARAPVAFFGYPESPSRLLEAERTCTLADPEDDAVSALEALADAVGTAAPSPAGPSTSLDFPTGRLDAAKLCAGIASRLPEDAIVVETAATSGLEFFPRSASAAPHSLLTLTGGAIGQGPPCAAGAALACPDRRVVNFQADGSAAYTLQSLWTQAHEGLDVTTVICANRRYLILEFELMRAGVKQLGRNAADLVGLRQPELDWVSLARGFGVPATRVESAEELDRELRRSFEQPGPYLIEAIL